MANLKDIKKCANALYLLGDLQQAIIYLTALADAGIITEEKADEILNVCVEEDEKITYGEVMNLRALF